MRRLRPPGLFALARCHLAAASLLGLAALGTASGCTTPAAAPVSPSTFEDPEPYTPSWAPNDTSGTTLTLRENPHSVSGIAQQAVVAVLTADAETLRRLVGPQFYYSGSNFRGRIPLERLLRRLPRTTRGTLPRLDPARIRPAAELPAGRNQRFPPGTMLVEIPIDGPNPLWMRGRAFVLIDPNSSPPVLGL